MQSEFELTCIKFADGDLKSREEVEVIRQCEIDPNLWRELALTFVESRELLRQYPDLTAPETSNVPMASSKDSFYRSWRPAIISLAVASLIGVLFAFSLARFDTNGGRNSVASELKKSGLQLEKVVWQEDFAAGQKNADDSGRPMLAMFSSQWCKHCEFMRDAVFDTAEVNDVLKEYVPVCLDIRQNAELAKSYDITTLPTFLLIERDEVTTRRVGGFSDATAFASFVRGALNRSEPLEAVSQPH